MPMLDGQMHVVEIAPGYTMTAPHMIGSIEKVELTESSTRSTAPELDAQMSQALDGMGMITAAVIQLDIANDGGPDTGMAPGTRSAGTTPMRLTTPNFSTPTEHYSHVVLDTDDSGYSRWVWPVDQTTGSATRGGGGSVVFELPRENASTPAPNSTRGDIINFGRRIVRVITWVTDPLIGAGAKALAKAWETKNDKLEELLHWPSGERLSDWAHLTGGKALLFIHGTFSSAQGGFGAVLPPTYAALQQRYQNRIIAFNHYTLHKSPEENVTALLQQLPAEVELDIITHSRGGLVGRELVRRFDQEQRQGGKRSINRAVLVASPNRGTPLADGKHWLEMLDRYTNLLTELPDNVITLTLEGILTIVKLVGHAALDGLPGLAVMNPSGSFLNDLNANPPSAPQYYALVANYLPKSQGWLKNAFTQAKDALIDHFFGEENDGVVPTAGGYNSHKDGPGWEIAQRRMFDTSSNINHNSFFKSPVVNEQILEWLD